jgi:hypothetical protein
MPPSAYFQHFGVKQAPPVLVIYLRGALVPPLSSGRRLSSTPKKIHADAVTMAHPISINRHL